MAKGKRNRRGRRRLREGALSAEQTPTRPPARPKLVPLHTDPGALLRADQPNPPRVVGHVGSEAERAILE